MGLRGVAEAFTPTVTMASGDGGGGSVPPGPTEQVRELLMEMSRVLDMTPMRDTVVIDLVTCGLKRSEFVSVMTEVVRMHPDFEFFLDGDTRSVIARRRAVSA